MGRNLILGSTGNATTVEKLATRRHNAGSYIQKINLRRMTKVKIRPRLKRRTKLRLKRKQSIRRRKQKK